MTASKKHRPKAGFTIVELLVVVVVIGILAAISIVSYNGIVSRATETTLKADLRNIATQLEVTRTKTGTYPNPELDSDIKVGQNFNANYTSNGLTYCVTLTPKKAPSISFYISPETTITEGVCPSQATATDGIAIQNVSTANCPDGRIRAVDTRDNRTYWVGNIKYGQYGSLGCWMLTNLAYAGGGNNVHGDASVALTLASSGTSSASQAYYYVPPTGANPTSEPNSPSTATNGTGQYGYAYNWCAAMGAQVSTSACSDTASTGHDPNVSICPSGWKLPTAEEFDTLNIVNLNSTTSDNGLLNGWLAQRAGGWFFGSYSNQGTVGYYWSSSTTGANSTAKALTLSSTSVSTGAGQYKSFGHSVRCKAI